MSIRVKLAVALSVAVAASVAIMSALFLASHSRTLRAAEAERTNLLVDGVRRAMDEAALSRDPMPLLAYLAYLRKDRPEIARVRVHLHGRWEEPSAQAASVDQARLIVVRPSLAAGPPTATEVEIYLSDRELVRRRALALRSMLRVFVPVVGLVLLTGLAVSSWLGWTMTRRLIALAEALRAVGAGDLGVRVPVEGRDEIAGLARGVNVMAESLAELDRMKKDFVASVSHELRSPLGAISSYASLLSSEATQLSEGHRRHLERISDNAARLGHFVTSLLDLARIERGALDFRPGDCRIHGVVADVCSFLAPKAVGEGKTLRWRAEDGLPTARADSDLVTQAVTNVVSNAINFSPRGGVIEVTVRRNGDGIECEVADQGRGFDPGDKARLFRPFVRGRNASGVPGTGLGLALCKSIADLHGGRIDVQSELGRGSRVSLWFPVGRPS